MEVLLSGEDLCGLLGRPELVLLDVRYRLGDTRSRDHYLAAHLPGAVYVDLDRELAAPPSAAAGRHPLPRLADLQDAARRWGVHSGSHVVVYDDWTSMAAARAWWLLRWAGLSDVQILDGALPAWRAAGLPLETGQVTPATGDVVLSAGHLPVVDADGVAHLAGRPGRAVVLDARAGERYRGEVEPIDPVAGHIPGALSAPTTDNLDSTGHFLPEYLLRQRFSALGINTPDEVMTDTTTAVYCGSGVTAAHQIAALAIAGFEAALYPGSWSQWSNDPDRPVATGA
jgi:thiosulfate/3-mercaptopyruvate sulfurtransferase